MNEDEVSVHEKKYILKWASRFSNNIHIAQFVSNKKKNKKNGLVDLNISRRATSKQTNQLNPT